MGLNSFANLMISNVIMNTLCDICFRYILLFFENVSFMGSKTRINFTFNFKIENSSQCDHTYCPLYQF